MLGVLVAAVALLLPTGRLAANAGAPQRGRAQRADIRLSAPEPDLGSSLQSTFDTALALQRAGDPAGALARYELFVQAAEQCDVPPVTYAEVLVNMGTIYARRQEAVPARDLFERALRSRDIGSAHLNLALLDLAAGAEPISGHMRIDVLERAEKHCRRTIELRDDPNSFAVAQRVLRDIERSRSGYGA